MINDWFDSLIIGNVERNNSSSFGDIICLLSSIDKKESKNRNNLSLSFISSNFAEIFVSMDSM